MGRWGRWTAVAILLLAFGLRVHWLGAQSFWNDEGNSARLSERAIPLILEGTASDIHPPLYYLMLHGWRALAGTTEFGLRMFSAVAGLLTVAVVWGLGRMKDEGRRMKDELRSTAVLAAVLAAVNPGLIYYSQETRMYALLGLLAALTAWLLGQWWRALGGGGRWWGWAVAYVLAAAAGLYTHYFFPAVLLVQNVVVGVWLIQCGKFFTQRRKGAGGDAQSAIRNPKSALLIWVGLMTAVLLLYAPWLPVFVGQFGADDLGTRPGLAAWLVQAVGWLAFGGTWTAVWWAVAGVTAVLLWGAVVGWRRSWPLTVALLLPLLLMWVAGTVQPAYMKFLLVALPFFCLLLAVAVVGDGRRRWMWLPGVVLLLALPLGTVASLQNLYGNPAYARADYRGMAARILADDQLSQAVILNAPNQWEVFTYYYGDDTAVFPLPEGRSRPTPEAIDAALTAITAQYDRVYVLFWGEAQRDPERLVERWLDARAFKAVDEWVGDVRLVLYAVPQAPATTMETALEGVTLGEEISLLGYTLNGTTFQPGEVLQLALFWQTAVPLDTRYKVFVHLVGPDGAPVAQRDSEPGGGLALTTTWTPGEVVQDNHGVLLPVGLANGRYTLQIGLYDLADPTKRLPISTPAGVLDALPLAEIVVGE
jgi:hypothetical protein